MPQSEFSLIQQYFHGVGRSKYAATLSIGDDAAVVQVPSGKQAVVCVDTLVAGVHFPEQTTAADLAYKALAVNLSDLAAMAAEPAWFLLSLTMPESDEVWLQAFSQGLKQIADDYQIELIGGDTCRGPLSVTIQATGLVDNNNYVTRSGAQPGDRILVSGELGNAALGLAHVKGELQLPDDLIMPCISALNRPLPRLALSPLLGEYATAAIDLSDGLVGDLKHILTASGVGARLRQSDLPVNEFIRQNQIYQYALNGGDDYELCFTIKPQHLAQISLWNAHHADCALQDIGEISESGYFLETEHQPIDLNESRGYLHFGE